MHVHKRFWRFSLAHSNRFLVFLSRTDAKSFAVDQTPSTILAKQMFNLFSSTPRIGAFTLSSFLFISLFFYFGCLAKYSLGVCVWTFTEMNAHRNWHTLCLHSTLYALSFIRIIPVCLRLCVWHDATRFRIVCYNPAVFFVEIIDERLIHLVDGGV